MGCYKVHADVACPLVRCREEYSLRARYEGCDAKLGCDAETVVSYLIAPEAASQHCCDAAVVSGRPSWYKRAVPSRTGGLKGAEAKGQGPPSKDWSPIHLLPAQQGTPAHISWQM